LVAEKNMDGNFDSNFFNRESSSSPTIQNIVPIFVTLKEIISTLLNFKGGGAFNFAGILP